MTGSGCPVAAQINVMTTPSLADTLMGKPVMTGGTKMRGGGRIRNLILLVYPSFLGV